MCFVQVHYNCWWKYTRRDEHVLVSAKLAIGQLQIVNFERLHTNYFFLYEATMEDFAWADVTRARVYIVWLWLLVCVLFVFVFRFLFYSARSYVCMRRLSHVFFLSCCVSAASCYNVSCNRIFFSEHKINSKAMNTYHLNKVAQSSRLLDFSEYFCPKFSLLDLTPTPKSSGFDINIQNWKNSVQLYLSHRNTKFIHVVFGDMLSSISNNAR